MQVVISDANDIAGVYTAIRMIGALMAKDDAAEALIGDMQATFDEIAAKSEKSGKTIYFEGFPRSSGGLWTAGSGTFMDELATMCGVTNAFADISGWQSVSEEQVIERSRITSSPSRAWAIPPWRRSWAATVGAISAR